MPDFYEQIPGIFQGPPGFCQVIPGKFQGAPKIMDYFVPTPRKKKISSSPNWLKYFQLTLKTFFGGSMSLPKKGTWHIPGTSWDFPGNTWEIPRRYWELKKCVFFIPPPKKIKNFITPKINKIFFTPAQKIFFGGWWAYKKRYLEYSRYLLEFPR